MIADIFAQCQAIFPQWATFAQVDFDFDDPKGFSSFTMGIRARQSIRAVGRVQPPAVLYRRLEGKENAILDFETEKAVFLLLGEHDIAAKCHHYDETCRIEQFYQGRTLRADELFHADILGKIAGELYRFHQLTPPGLPQVSFWDLLFEKWGALARHVLHKQIDRFPPNEQEMAEDLRQICSPATLERVRSVLPDDGPLTFCHNDTYHGNIMRLDSGAIKLLDFEFSCLNHKTYDFSNLFAETVMRHGLPDYPHFHIAEPDFGDREFGILINAYLDHATFATPADREQECQKLLADTKRMVVLSHFKYALAALPLALAPIQKIRFIPYAHQRFHRFLQAAEAAPSSP